MRTRSLVPSMLCAALLATLAQPSPAAVVTVPYDVFHDFDFNPVGDVLDTRWTWSAFASARLPLDRDTERGHIRVTPGGYTKTAMVAATGAEGVANARLNYMRLAGNHLDGRVQSDGFAQADRAVAGADAYATSKSVFTARGGVTLANGRIRWGPTFTATSNGVATTRVKDPIDFEIFDLAQDRLLSGNLFTFEVDLWDAGSVAVAGGLFLASAVSMDFHIVINDAFVPAAQAGTAMLRVRRGVVTASSATGIFAGLLPAVGEDGDFSFPMDEFLLDYDLGSLPPGAEIIDFHFSNSGLAHIAPSPAAATLMLGGLGLLMLARARRGALRVG